MKYLLIYWALGGPQVTGVFHDEALCNALAEKQEDGPSVRFCVELVVDTLVTDMVQWTPGIEKQLKVLKHGKI